MFVGTLTSDSSRKLFHDATYITMFLFISECISFYKFSKIYAFILLSTDISVIYSLSYYERNCCKHLCISFVETCFSFSWENKSEIAASYYILRYCQTFSIWCYGILYSLKLVWEFQLRYSVDILSFLNVGIPAGV